MTPYVNLKGDFRKHWETYSGTLEENSGPFANQRRAWKQLLLNYEQYLDNREGYQGQAGTYFNPVDERLASCRRDHHGQESPIYYSLHATLIMRRALQIVQGHYNGTADLGGRFPERLHSLLDPLNAMASNYTSVLAACREDGLDLRALLAKASDLAQHQDNLFSAKWTDLCEYKEVMAQVQELGDQHDAVLAQICEAKQVHEFRTGWCMHGLGIDALFGYMDQHLEWLAANLDANPIYQELFFSNLPTEVLFQIVDHLDTIDRIRLAQVSSRIRSVITTGLYKMRKIVYRVGDDPVFDLPADLANFNFQHEREKANHSLQESIRYLLEDRPDIPPLVEDLSIRNNHRNYYLLPLAEIENSRTALSSQSHRQLVRLMEASCNTVKLELLQVNLDMDTVRILSRMYSLRELSITACSIVGDLLRECGRATTSSFNHPRFPSITDLTIRLDSPLRTPEEDRQTVSIDNTSLYFMVFCPTAIALNVSAPLNSSVTFPGNLFALCTPFEHAKYIMMEQLHIDSLGEVADWTASAVQRRTLVTEYLSLDGYMNFNTPWTLVTSLNGASSLSLKALILRGLPEIRLDELEQLAACLPELKGLWLGRELRSSSRNRSRPWPFTTQELAVALSGLRSLEQFGCNGLTAASERVSVTPNCLLDFESDFQREQKDIVERQSDIYGDEELEVKLLACHLVSLKAFYDGINETLAMQYPITRSQGCIEVTRDSALIVPFPASGNYRGQYKSSAKLPW